MSATAKSSLGAFLNNETHARNKINLTPSENILSPLSRLPFLMDIYGRYFLDDLRLFGYWAFPSGEASGSFEQGVLLPLLSRLCRAKHTNVRAISGINCMTIALAAWAKSGDNIFSVPVSAGGHPSTELVARRLGLNVHYIPFLNAFDVDNEKFEKTVRELNPTLIYIDQGSMLFPVDPQSLRDVLQRCESKAIIHYDSSHLNGLILGNAMFNPLERGADCFGGSTHKTLPGPHKGFIATNDESLAAAYKVAADHFVSHHHTASMVSLCVTLQEMDTRDGNIYARNVIKAAQQLARLLDKGGYEVAARDRGYTACHQVWAHPRDIVLTKNVYQRLSEAGIIVNMFGGMPGVPNAVYRLSPAEFVKRGAEPKHIEQLASLFISALDFDYPVETLRADTSALARDLPSVAYCFNPQEYSALGILPDLISILDKISAL